jgi:DNA-binding NarL/FixJ family response regulator
MIRILIADDHAVVRKGLKQILLDDFPSCEIEEVSNTEELILKVMKSNFDVVISDLSMPGRSGMEALQYIKQHYPKLPVLILSMHAEEHYALRVLKAGASGYLGKDSASTELVKAVNRVLLGKKYITSTIAEKLASSLDRDSEKLSHEYLSDREFEVLKMLANGNRFQISLNC